MPSTQCLLSSAMFQHTSHQLGNTHFTLHFHKSGNDSDFWLFLSLLIFFWDFLFCVLFEGSESVLASEKTAPSVCLSPPFLQEKLTKVTVSFSSRKYNIIDKLEEWEWVILKYLTEREKCRLPEKTTLQVCFTLVAAHNYPHHGAYHWSLNLPIVTEKQKTTHPVLLYNLLSQWDCYDCFMPTQAFFSCCYGE